MRKLFNEFFYIPEHGKVREKVMLTRVAMTVVIMVMCLAAMSITAYAYFSYNVTSGSNTIKSANFEANVSIKITNPDSGTVPLTKDGLTQKVTLPTVGTYTVELTPGDSTAKTGFCVITIGGKTYYTQQFGKDQTIEANAEAVTFTLIVSSETEITILSSWGTSSCYGYANRDDNPLYIQNGDPAIDLSAATTDLNDSQINDGKDTADDKTSADTTQPVDTTVPNTSTTPPETTVPIETTTPTTTTTHETTGTSEPTTTTEPSSTTEPATQTTDSEVTEQTQPTTENTETTGTPTTEANRKPTVTD